MKAIKQYQSPTGSGSPKPNLPMAALCALALVAGANAQPVLVTQPSLPAATTQTSSDQSSDTNEVDAAGGVVAVSAAAAQINRNPFQWGPVTLHPRIGYGYTYGTGLQSQPGDSRKSSIQSISPGMGFDLGKLWVLGYTASLNYYSDPKFHDSLDHTITLRGSTTYEDWTFNLSQAVALTSDPLVETAQQTDQQSYVTSFGAGYQINSDFSVDLNVGQNIRDTQGYTNSVGSSRDWSAMGWLNYLWGPYISTGVGIGVGYNSVAVGNNMTYEDYQARAGWRFARKLNLSVSGGAQVRQFIGSGQDSMVSPTFGVSLSYQPFRATALSISASRGISASYFQNQVTESTSVTASLSQRFLKRYSLNLSGGYALTTYQDSSTSSTAFSGRDDTRTFFSIGISTGFLKRGTASVSYSKSKNNSSKNFGAYSYNSEQFSLSLGYSY